MRCRESCRSILERELGLLPDSRLEELDRHLATCASCTTHAASEVRLSADLAALAASAPPEVDVTSAVAARIATLPPGPERPAGLYGWALAAAVAGAIAVGWAAFGLPAAAADLGRELSPLLAALRSSVGALTETTLGVAAAVARALVGLASAAAIVLRSLRPIGTAVVTAGLLAMSATVAAVVARDLLRRPAAMENRR